MARSTHHAARGELARASSPHSTSRSSPGSNAHVSFHWVGLGEDEAEKLEGFVFDAVLDELKG